MKAFFWTLSYSPVEGKGRGEEGRRGEGEKRGRGEEEEEGGGRQKKREGCSY